MENKKEIRKQLRLLRKLKKDTPLRSQARRDINKSIRALKESIIPICIEVTQQKQKLINTILQYQPELNKRIDLTVYTEEQLQKHIDNLRRKI
jgi:hypothetical protein